MLRQSGNAPRYSLLLMSESTTRSDGWTSCSLYCLKPSSSPPAVALCLHLERRLWWLMHSLLGSRGKNVEFLLKCFAHIVVIRSHNIYTAEQRWKITKLKIMTVSHSAMCAAQDRLNWCLFVLSGMSRCLSLSAANSSLWTCTSRH